MDKEALVKEILNHPAYQRISNDRHRGEHRGGGLGFVLAYLHDHGGMAFPGEIGQAMGVSTPRVAAILRELEEKGMITREVMPDDRRKVCVTLTDKGKEIVMLKQKRSEQTVRQVVDLLSEEDAGAIPRILDVLGKVQSDAHENEKERFHQHHET